MDVDSSRAIYRTIDWYEIPYLTRLAVSTYIDAVAKTIDFKNPDHGIAWNNEYDVTIESYTTGWYLRFNSKDGYTKFVLQWM